MKLLFLVAVLVFLGGIAFADIGPGPSPAGVIVNVKENGAPYAGTVEMTYLCSVADVRTTESSSVDPYDMKMTCADGSCTRPAYYKFNPCFYSKGRFELKAKGKTLTSTEISLESPGAYRFDMDVNSGALTGASGNPQPPSPNPSPSPDTDWRNSCCCSSGALFALLIGGAWVRSRQ